MGYYVANPANLISPEQSLLQNWFQNNTPAPPLDGTQFRFSGNGQQIGHLPLTPIAGYVQVLKNQTYTVGITRVSGTGTLQFGIRAFYLDDGTNFATGTTVNNTVAGRVFYTFTTPNNDRPKGIALVATLTTGYAAGTPLIVKAATLVNGASDIGELPPTFIDTTGWGIFDLRVVSWVPNGDRYKVIPVDDVECSFPLSDVGSLKFKYSQSMPDWALLTANHAECSVEVTTDGVTWTEPEGARFYRTSNGYDDIQFLENGEFGFSSFGWFLGKINMNGTATLNDKGRRVFATTNVGIVLKTIIDEEKAAGVVTGLNYDFSTTLDSNGAAWSKTFNIDYAPGVSLRSVLQGFVDQGLVEWTTQGRTLRVFNVAGGLERDLSTSVIYKAGYEIVAAPNQTSNESLVSRFVGYGDNGAKVVLTNPGAVTPYGHFEGSSTYSGVADTGTMTILQQASLDAGAQILRQKTRQCDWTRASKFPLHDFRMGDYIGTVTTDAQLAPSSDRVRQITLTYSKEKGVGGNLVLNSRFEELQIRLAKKQNSLTSGMQLGGSGTTPAPNFPGADVRVPKAPTSLVLSTAAYLDPNGVPWAAISLDWADVTQATDNTAIDITSYEVQYRLKNLVTPEEWRWITAVMNPGVIINSFVTMSPFLVGTTYEFRVRAMAQTSSKPGLFSATAEITAAVDTTPPPVPTAPILATRGGAISITWDGKGMPGGTQPMPLDFDFIIIEVSDTSNFTVTRSIGEMSNAGTIAIADLPYNVTRFFRFRSVDNSRNMSAWSATSSISTAALVSTDLIGQIIQTANLALNSVNESIIADSAITHNKIRAGSITSSRLAVGGTNRIVDPHFMNTSLNTIRIASATTPAWVTIAPASAGSVNGHAQIAPTAATITEMFLNETTTDVTNRYPIEVIEGETYYFEFLFTRVSGTNTGGMRITWLLNTGGTASANVIDILAGTANGVLTGTWVCPAGVVGARVSFFVGAQVSSQRFSNPGMFLQAGATLIEDGAITTNKIVANAITGAKIAALTIDAGNINTNAITTDKIVSGAISSIHIAADAIDGKTITGAVLRTAATGARIEITPTGIYQRNASSTIVSQWLPASFSFKTALGGARTEFDATGIRLYDSAGVNTVNLSTATGNATITGKLRTNPVGTYPWTEINNELWPNNFTGIRFYANNGQAGQAEVIVQAFGDYGDTNYSTNGGSLLLKSGEVTASGAGATGRAELGLITDGHWYLGRRAGTGALVGGNISAKAWGDLSIGGATIWSNAGATHNLVAGNGDFNIFCAGGTIRMQHWTGSAYLTRLQISGWVTVHTSIQYSGAPTVAGGGNAVQWAGSDSRLYVVTSLSKYKLEQEPIKANYSFLDIVPKTWVNKTFRDMDPDHNMRSAGFVAEEVRDLSAANNHEFDSLLVFDGKGELNSLAYDRFFAYAVPIMKDMAERIRQLEEEMAGLKTS